MAEFAATVTVTVYVAVVPFAAVTRYDTGVVKLLGVVPLTWFVPPTVGTPAPVVVNVATKPLGLVPNGMVTAMVFGVSDSFIIPGIPFSV